MRKMIPHVAALFSCCCLVLSVVANDAVIDDVSVEVAPVENAVAQTEEGPAVPLPQEDGETDAPKGLKEISVRLAQAAVAYDTGVASCGETLNVCNECLTTLDNNLCGYQATPAWQDCRTEAVEIRSELPCCGGGETIIGEEIIGDPIISEEIIAPAPLDEAFLPAPMYGGGGFGGGFGGGGGGGGFGGGGLLGLAGLGTGVAALALGADDDDDTPPPAASPF